LALGFHREDVRGRLAGCSEIRFILAASALVARSLDRVEQEVLRLRWMEPSISNGASRDKASCGDE
jgi:hypothetical protein